MQTAARFASGISRIAGMLARDLGGVQALGFRAGPNAPGPNASAPNAWNLFNSEAR